MAKSDIKQKIYNWLYKPNDRAFSLVTIFMLSICLTYFNYTYSLADKFDNIYIAFAALVCLVISTLLSSIQNLTGYMRKVSAFLCIFLWLFAASLSGALDSNDILSAGSYYTLLFWSNINLLGVLLNGRK